MDTAREIIDAYRNGMTVAEIATASGREPRRINQTLRKAGIDVPIRKSVITKEALVDAQARGITSADLAREKGITNAAVHQQMRVHGVKLRDGRTYPDGTWKGSPRGRQVIRLTSGYRMVYKPDHPHCDKSGRVMEHRLVMEDHIGRFLDPVEVVHHMNHVRDDNRIENLMLLPNQRAHSQLHRPKGQPVAPGGNEARWNR